LVRGKEEDEKNFENHLLSKFFPDRDDVTWIELDGKRWEHAREREVAEEAALYPEYAAEKRSMNIIIYYPTPG
jgi:hypothetical protein